MPAFLAGAACGRHEIQVTHQPQASVRCQGGSRLILLNMCQGTWPAKRGALWVAEGPWFASDKKSRQKGSPDCACGTCTGNVWHCPVFLLVGFDPGTSHQSSGHPSTRPGTSTLADLNQVSWLYVLIKEWAVAIKVWAWPPM
jgi:hypothetical protein